MIKTNFREFRVFSYLNGKKYDDLDRSMQRVIEETQINTYQIEPQTPKRS